MSQNVLGRPAAVAPGSGSVLELIDKGEGSVIVYGALATCHALFLALDLLWL